MVFEWDDQKAASNRLKHGVAFEEAVTVFGDPLAISFEDPDHSKAESRYLNFGLSIAQRLLVVSYTDRGKAIRLLSARPATRKERKIYEEG